MGVGFFTVLSNPIPTPPLPLKGREAGRTCGKMALEYGNTRTMTHGHRRIPCGLHDEPSDARPFLIP